MTVSQGVPPASDDSVSLQSSDGKSQGKSQGKSNEDDLSSLQPSQKSIKRDLFSLQIVYPMQLTKNLRLSVQGGPALADTTRVNKVGGYSDYTDYTHLVFVHGITVSYSVTKNLAVVGMMQRTDFTQNTSDGLYLGLRFSTLSF